MCRCEFPLKDVEILFLLYKQSFWAIWCLGNFDAAIPLLRAVVGHLDDTR